MKIIAFIISGLYFVKNNEFANTLESIKNLYNGIDLIVVQIESSSNVVPEKIQIQLLELLKKLKLNNKNRPSFTDEKDDSNFINYTTAITRATISGINSILENINKIREIEHNKKRELALQQLKERIEKRKKEGIKETPETKKFEKTFYEIMDSFRPEGWKLYQEN
jgi:methylmalonyl-CoA mutase N-terminal domain/subunit